MVGETTRGTQVVPDYSAELRIAAEQRTYGQCSLFSYQGDNSALEAKPQPTGSNRSLNKQMAAHNATYACPMSRPYFRIYVGSQSGRAWRNSAPNQAVKKQTGVQGRLEPCFASVG